MHILDTGTSHTAEFKYRAVSNTTFCNMQERT